MTIILDQKRDNVISTDEFRQKLSHQMRDRNRVGLGWLRFSCSVKYLTYWKKRVQTFFRVKLREREKGWQGYTESLEGGFGILIGFTPVMTELERQEARLKKSPNEGKMTIDLTQSALDSLSDRNHLGLWIDIFGCPDVKFKRVDIYYDDYCKTISPEALHKACKGGGVGVPRFTNLRGWDEYDLQNGKSRGFTAYIGSPKSDRQFRYYDKTLESDGEQDCNRLELEDKDQYAEKFGEYIFEVLNRSMDCKTIAESVSMLRDAYKAVLKGAIKFLTIPSNKCQKELERNWANRLPETWWWREMMAGLEPAKLTVNRVKPSLPKLHAWIKNQVAPGLALIKMVYDHWSMPFRVWLDELLNEGEARWQAKHWKMVEEAMLTSPAY